MSSNIPASAIRELSIEGRLTVSNMAIEHGARAGLIAPDAKTFAYVKGRPYAPKGADWDAAVAWWTSLATDPGATYDKVGADRRGGHRPDRDLGHQPGRRACRSPAWSPPPPASPIPPSRKPRANRSTTWG